jgi:hypothetical protein
MSTRTRRRATATATATRAELSTAARYPITGHWAGPKAYIGIAVDAAGDWAVYDSNAGTRPPDYWNGKEWLPLTPQSAPVAHRWNRSDAEAWARHYAQQAGVIYQKAETAERRAFLHWLAGHGELAIQEVKDMLDDLHATRQPVASVQPLAPETVPRATAEPDTGPEEASEPIDDTVQIPTVDGEPTAAYDLPPEPDDEPTELLPQIPQTT